MSASTPNEHRARELERRIAELEAQDEASFGHFTIWDWSVCVAFAVVLPVLLIWRWAA